MAIIEAQRNGRWFSKTLHHPRLLAGALHRSRREVPHEFHIYQCEGGSSSSVPARSHGSMITGTLISDLHQWFKITPAIILFNFLYFLNIENSSFFAPQPKLQQPQLNMPDKIRKWQSGAINRKKRTVIANIHKLVKFLAIAATFIICQNGQYTTYHSVGRADFPSTKEWIKQPMVSSL